MIGTELRFGPRQKLLKASTIMEIIKFGISKKFTENKIILNSDSLPIVQVLKNFLKFEFKIN